MTTPKEEWTFLQGRLRETGCMYGNRECLSCDHKEQCKAIFIGKPTLPNPRRCTYKKEICLDPEHTEKE